MVSKGKLNVIKTIQQIGIPCIISLKIMFTISQPIEAQETSSKLLHIEKTATVEFASTKEAVFALLEPQGRRRRIRSWNMEYLYPESGEARPGTLVRQVHRSGAVEQIWLLAEHDPPNRIKYVIFVAGMETWEFDVRLQSKGENETIANVNHRITALAEEINVEVQSFADNFDAYINRWRTSINEALENN